ncbi:DMT family transporter [Enterococcus sp. LJL99]
MKQKKAIRIGHVFALITILIWGTTFVSTKILLQTFTPIEILFTRFLIGFLLLIILYPHRLKLINRQEEWLFIAAGASGIALYYLLENIALTLTTASNVGIIITIAPFFTALFSMLFLKTEKPKKQFFIGFVVALIGITLIGYNGNQDLEINPLGDFLALFASLMWAIYAILTKKISDLGYNTIQTTRRIFFYGLLFMVPLLFILDFNLELKQFTNWITVANILFLGLGASALCFVTWSSSVRILGAVKTSVYIYLVPVVTLLSAVFILSEPLTIKVIIGAVLTLMGLWISEKRNVKKSVSTEK